MWDLIVSVSDHCLSFYSMLSIFPPVWIKLHLNVLFKHNCPLLPDIS